MIPLEKLVNVGLSVGIVLAIGVVIYMKVSKKSFKQVIGEVKEIFGDSNE